METVIRTVMIVVALSAGSVAAQNLDEARTRFKRGTELYDEGNYRGALIEFQSAFEASPNFKLLYNIGLVHLALQDYARAVQSFTRYLNEGGAEIPPARRVEVTKEIERLSPRIGKLIIETASGAEVLLDDERIGFAPLPGPVSANTGRHKIGVVVGGKEVTRIIDLAGQQNLTVAIANEAVAPKSAAPVEVVQKQPQQATTPPGVRPAVIVAWSVTAAAAFTALSFVGLAASASTELVSLRATFGVTKLALEDQATKSRNLAIVADSLMGATVVAAGVALWVTVSGASAPATTSLGVGPSGVVVRGEF